MKFLELQIKSKPQEVNLRSIIKTNNQVSKTLPIFANHLLLWAMACNYIVVQLSNQFKWNSLKKPKKFGAGLLISCYIKDIPYVVLIFGIAATIYV